MQLCSNFVKEGDRLVWYKGNYPIAYCELFLDGYRVFIGEQAIFTCNPQSVALYTNRLMQDENAY
jgi:hypothetical protein